MKKLLSIITLLASFVLSAQNEYYSQLPFGDFNIGFTDTVLYHSSETYKQYGYNGAKPILVQVWHPVKEVQIRSRLKVGDFISTQESPILSNVFKQLKGKFEENLLQNHLNEDYLHFDNIDYSPLSAEGLLEKINTTTTRSFAQPIDSIQDFPVVLYHHGSRGISYDNHIMAEYLASQGYIVVAGNFNWAFEKFPHGFSTGEKYDIVSVNIVAQFAQTLTTSKKIGFIGHSWGAQTGLMTLHKNDWVDAFVSMETTLELWNNAVIHKRWPQLAKTISLNAGNYATPMLFLANQGDNSPIDYTFFRRMKNAPNQYCSSVKEFGHEFYAGIYSLRYLYRNEFDQPDAQEMSGQIEIYCNTLKLVHSFMEENLKSLPQDYKQFHKHFYIKSNEIDGGLISKTPTEKLTPSSP